MPIIVITFIMALFMNVLALRRISLLRLTFLDGTVIGMTYYLTIPMIAILLSGRIGPSFLPIDDYRPFDDITTTTIIIMFIVSLSTLRLASRRHEADARFLPMYSTSLLTAVVLALYLVTTIVSFVASGMSSGGHWLHASHELMQQDSGFLLLKITSNFTRTAAFGCLAALSMISPRFRYLSLLTGAAICLIDLMTTFNRICIVYYLLLVVICFRRHLLTTSALVSCALVFGIFFSNIFTEIRGLVSVYGYSVSGFSNAISVAVAHAQEDEPFVDQMNGVFESMNITALNYVIKNQEKISVPVGAYFIRPLTIILPRALLPDRPEVFAMTLGRHITGVDGAAINSTIIGEPYANSSVLWPAMLLVVVAFYQMLYSWLSRYSRAYGAIGAFIAFAFWRFDSSFAATSALMCVTLHCFLALLALGARDVTRSGRRYRRSLPLPGVSED
jgi:hypothetical protein